MVIIGNNGVELEGYIQDPTKININSLGLYQNEGMNFLRKEVNSAFYFDDGKPEYPSTPHKSLGGLSDELIKVITKATTALNAKGLNFLLVGNEPFYDSFASGHIHSSLSANPSKTEQSEMRRRLFSVQPFIALLGQNSAIMNGNISDVKDVRLAYGHWSEFTYYNSLDSSHYLSLANGRKAITLETRIPSSCTLQQMLGCVAFVKTILNLSKSPEIVINTEQTFYSVIQWGGQALVKISNPLTLDFLGIGKDEIYIQISELFKFFVTKGESAEILSQVLEELPTEYREKVREYYDIICSGYTASDYYTTLFNEMRFDRVKLSNKLNEITLQSYSNNKGFWDLIKKPETPIIPLIDETITLEELDNMVKSWKSSVNIDAIDKWKEFESFIKTHDYSLLRYKPAYALFEYFRSRERDHIIKIKNIIPEIATNHFLLGFFKNYRVIKEKESVLYKDMNYPIVAQLLKEAENFET